EPRADSLARTLPGLETRHPRPISSWNREMTTFREARRSDPQALHSNDDVEARSRLAQQLSVRHFAECQTGEPDSGSCRTTRWSGSHSVRSNRWCHALRLACRCSRVFPTLPRLTHVRDPT